MLPISPLANTGSWREAKAGTRPFSRGSRRESLRRELVDVEAVDARTIRVARQRLRQSRQQRLSRPAIPRGPDRAGGRVGRRAMAPALALRASSPAISIFLRASRRRSRALKGKPAALIMASGFQANAAVLAGSVRSDRARRRASRLRRPPQPREHAFRLQGRQACASSATGMAMPPISASF